MEASLFGSKFFSILISVEMIYNLMYKFRCFGLDIDVPAEVLCDNNYVVTNSSVS